LPDSWVPRNNLEKLIQVDTLLAGLIPRFGSARERIVDTLPGHSGKPAGNGDPGGGSGGGHGASVVERTSARWDSHAADLERLDRLAAAIVDRLMHEFPTVTGPIDNGAVRRLVWARWVVRALVQFGPRRASQLKDGWLLRLHGDVDQLYRIVEIWADPREAPAARSAELAVDDTEALCRSCLRVGARNDRSPIERQRAAGLCRWCGDFQEAQGFLPTLAIVDLHESGAAGSTIARAIKDERRTRGLDRTKPAKKKRRRR
jgi:hypothetical protein